MTTLVPSFSNRSSSFLQVIRTRSLDEFEFRSHTIPVYELTPIERLKN